MPTDQSVNDSKALMSEDLAAGMPTVDLHAVQAANQQKTAENHGDSAPAPAAPAAAQAAAQEPPPVDGQGRPFNRLIHETDEAGGPVFRKGTRVLKCRRTPLTEWKETSVLPDVPAAGAGSPVGAPSPVEAPDAAAEAQRAAMRTMSAAMMAGTMISLGRIALGDEFADEDADRAALVASFEAVLAHHQVDVVNPWMGLAIVAGSITVKAVNKPKARPKVERAWAWMKVRAYALYLRFGGKATPAASAGAPRPNQPAP